MCTSHPASVPLEFTNVAIETIMRITDMPKYRKGNVIAEALGRIAKNQEDLFHKGISKHAKRAIALFVRDYQNAYSPMEALKFNKFFTANPSGAKLFIDLGRDQ